MNLALTGTQVCAALHRRKGQDNMYRKRLFVVWFVVFCAFTPVSAVLADTVSIDFDTTTTNLTYNGDAFQDLTNGYAVLTPDDTWNVGSVWYNAPINVDQFTSTFDFYVGNSTSGADGITFAVIDTSNGLNALGYAGGGFGYLLIDSSFAVEFDTFSNVGTYPPGVTLNDPNDNHVGINQDGDVLSLVTDTAIPVLEDGASHTAQIVFNSGNMRVYLDSVLRLDYDLSGYPSVGYVGFTGGTGDLKNLQYVDNWILDAEIIPEPISLVFFGTGLVGVFGFVARRKMQGSRSP